MPAKTKHAILLESGTNELEVLVFSLDDQRYGVNVAKVREVIKPLTITALPETHPSVVGVFQLRSTVTPLIDLKKCLGKGAADADTGKIVIMEFNDVRVGFLVDTVEQIFRVNWKDVAAMPDMEGVNDAPLTSVAHINDHMVLMLDFEKLVFDLSGVDLFEEHARGITRDVARGDRRILHAEDSHVMRKLIRSNLVKAGYTDVTQCVDGQDAWDTLTASLTEPGKPTFDLIITDIEMPRIDGLHLTRRIKEHAQLKAIPVIVFSSLVSTDNDKKCKAVGADAQITKPELDTLVDLADRLLAEHAGGAARANSARV